MIWPNEKTNALKNESCFQCPSYLVILVRLPNVALCCAVKRSYSKAVPYDSLGAWMS